MDLSWCLVSIFGQIGSESEVFGEFLLRTRFVQRVIRPRRQRTVENLFKLAGLLSLFLSRVIILPLADESDASPDNLESESKCR